LLIEARTAKECFDAYRDDVAHLVSNTISHRYPIRAVALDGELNRRRLSFWHHTQAVAIPLATRFGRLYFYFNETLGVREYRSSLRPIILAYAYRLQIGPEVTSRALVRWEYAAGVNRLRRHHLHADGRLDDPTLRLPLDLDKLHLATGPVAIDDIVRFLVADLGHRPPCGIRRCEDLLQERQQTADRAGHSP
jgi:hypothetical protein